MYHIRYSLTPLRVGTKKKEKKKGKEKRLDPTRLYARFFTKAMRKTIRASEETSRAALIVCR